ncbi:Zn(2)-C6 fungal-type domain-containing protein [Mycena venus]|uniref:Zn(2)-C6 fungal-type domain-containing protein n=1 Tax=Mycena venus TaxID=2733690 RepID=A0A8H7CHH5_9AGAR|nr:Zn(2)-C6 fungal-type domain-containing protein [Mycena venus]
MKEEYLGRPLPECRRPLFWDLLPWEKEAYNRRQRYAFPPSDLIGSLLHLYFAHVHPTIPILHRPSFMRFVAEGLHTENIAFGGTLLSVLAVASRYSDDPRVFVDGETSLSAGWKFYEQIQIPRKFFEPTIHEVQMYLLLSLYASGTSVPQASWLYLGLGVRCLQRRSDYRRKPDGQRSSPNDELWKRAFWSFVIFDRTTSAFLGQPMGMQLDDYDVEFPLEVDDEYWDQGLTQPSGQLSQLSYFLCHIRVCEILGDASRRLYGTKKSRILMGWDGPDWEQRAVAELDSTMNDFLDSIPSHLKWDPESPPHGLFFDQSVTLHVSYNFILIAIHRPYIQKMTTLAAPSLFICARAARAIINTTYIWLKTRQRLPQPCLTNPVFVSGIVLVLCMLGAKRSGLSANQEKDLAHIVTAMDILKVAESRSQSAGRLWEILRELCSLDGALPLNSSTNNKADLVPVTASPTTITESSVAYPADEHLPQPSQPFDFEHHPLPSDQSSGPRPGMSIEQLLADADPLDSMGSILDDEFMSMWMAAPTDVLTISHWDAYIENRNNN